MGRALEQRVAQLAAFDAEQALVGQVAQAGWDLQAQQIEAGNHDIGVAGRVGGVLEQGPRCFVTQHLVQHIGRIARGGGNNPAAELRVLVGRVGIKGPARSQRSGEWRGRCESWPRLKVWSKGYARCF